MPHKIVVCHCDQTKYKKYDGKGTGGIVQKKLSEHPDTIGQDPKNHGKVVHKIRSVLYRLIRYKYSHKNGRNDHDHSCNFLISYPTKVFDKPKNNVKILKFSKGVFHYDENNMLL